MSESFRHLSDLSTPVRAGAWELLQLTRWSRFGWARDVLPVFINRRFHG